MPVSGGVEDGGPANVIFRRGLATESDRARAEEADSVRCVRDAPYGITPVRTPRRVCGSRTA